MALSIAASTSGTTTTTAGISSFTITVPAAALTGDVLVVCIASGGFASEATPEAGWTTLIPGQLYTRVHDDTDNSAVFTFADSLTGNPVAWGILVLHSTLGFATPPVAFSTQGADTTGFEIGPSVDALSAALLVHFGFTVDDGVATSFTSTPPSGMTELLDKFQAASGSSIGAMGVHLSANWVAVAAAGSTGGKVSTLSRAASGTSGLLMLVSETAASSVATCPAVALAPDSEVVVSGDLYATASPRLSMAFWFYVGTPSEEPWAICSQAPLVEDGDRSIEEVTLTADVGDATARVQLTVTFGTDDANFRGSSLTSDIVEVTLGWHLALVSIDLDDGAAANIRGAIYFDRVNARAAFTQLAAFPTSGALAFEDQVLHVGRAGDHAPVEGLYDFWYAPGVSLLDSDGLFSDTTLDLFVNDHDDQVSLGAHGEAPTGARPAVFLRGDAATFGQPNLGNGPVSYRFGLFTSLTGPCCVEPTAAESSIEAWSFVLDGHEFYVLDLGDQGTPLYDNTTQQWCEFETEGYTYWNMRRGGMWNDRIVGASANDGTLLQLDPDAILDEGGLNIHHAVTGGVQTRSRTAQRQDSFRLAASAGKVGRHGARVRLRFSDDHGNTWSPYYDRTLRRGNYSQEIAWQSLGAIQAPGRVFEVSDTGGLIRIDGATADIEGMD